MDEQGRIARYAPQGDAEGLAAYALHRQALLAFRAEFATRHGRAPDEAEEAAFLIGEEAPARIETYRSAARALIGAPARKPATKPRARWLSLGQWVEAPQGFDPAQPINWRGLLSRLAMLMIAVIGTAVLLRVLFVKA